MLFKLDSQVDLEKMFITGSRIIKILLQKNLKIISRKIEILRNQF